MQPIAVGKPLASEGGRLVASMRSAGVAENLEGLNVRQGHALVTDLELPLHNLACASGCHTQQNRGGRLHPLCSRNLFYHVYATVGVGLQR